MKFSTNSCLQDMDVVRSETKDLWPENLGD